MADVKHFACDECRQRKLKCSGEVEGCQRCKREGLECVYSERKRMGRPRKDKRKHTEFEQETPQYPFIDESAGSGSTVLDIQSGWTTTDYGIAPADATTSNSTHDSMQPTDSGIRQNGDTTQCTCLSKMYIASASINECQNGKFVLGLAAVRAALKTSKELFECQICPTNSMTAYQNLMLQCTLLQTIAFAGENLSKAIDLEVARCEATGTKKPYRMGDGSPETRFVHTGTIDCPASFQVDLEPDEWGSLARRAVKNELFGCQDTRLTLEAILDLLEARQNTWHEMLEHFRDPSVQTEEHSTPQHNHSHSDDSNVHTCVRLIREVRRVLNNVQL